MVATLQYFLLNDAIAGHATRLTALQTAAAGHLGYTPDLTERTASYASNLKIVAAYVEEADLTGDLASLAEGVVPNATCQHRWRSAENFRALGGFHQMGESQTSFERDRDGNIMPGRTMLYIRPQIGITYSADDYDVGDGRNWFRALNGCQDHAIDQNAVGVAVWNKGYSYCLCDGVHARRSRYHMAPTQQHPDYGTGGVGISGKMKFEDATAAAADKVYVYTDWDMKPAIIIGGQYGWQADARIPWELYDATNNIWVLGSFNTGFVGTSVGSTGNTTEGDIEDLTVDAETLMARHIMHGMPSLSDLEGTAGRGRYHTQSFGGAVDFLAVKTHNTVSFTDVTAAAASTTSNDFEIMPVGAPNDFAIYFILATQHSGAEIDLSQVQVGATGVWEYPTDPSGSSWAQFTNISDLSNGFTTDVFNQWLQLNPKIDWAETTIDEVTGYAFRWRKTGGTVTQAARGNRARAKPSACFVHRWNDAAPGPIGLSHYSMSSGLRFDINTNNGGNTEFVRMRVMVSNMFGEFLGGDDMTFTGGQWIGTGGKMLLSVNGAKWTLREGSYGQRYWGIDDHLHTSKEDPFIQDILAQMQEYETVCAGDPEEQAILDEFLAAVGDTEIDYTCFDKLDDCLDLAWVGSGPYENNADCLLTYDGVKVRHPGDTFTRANGDVIFSSQNNDNHSTAAYGDQRGTNKKYKKIFTEYVRMGTDQYQQANGNNDMPVSGACGFKDNHKYVYGYASGIGNQVDVHFPVGLIYENDPDVGEYDNEPANNMSGNGGMFWGFKDISGVGVVANDQIHTFRALLFDNPNSECWHISGGFSNGGPKSTNAITFDGSSTYNNITDNLKVSGNTTTNLFSSGSAGAILYLGSVHRTERRFGVNIVTAGVGDAVLVAEYSDDGGSNWVEPANVSGLDFSSTGLKEITFDRPTDITSVDVGGVKTILAVRIRIVSGSYSTIPQANEINTYLSAGSIDIQYCRAKNLASGKFFGKTQTDSTTNLTNSSIIIDKNNTIELSAGQSSATGFYGRNGASTLTLASWQALSKTALTSNAKESSVFGVGNVLVPPP